MSLDEAKAWGALFVLVAGWVWDRVHTHRKIEDNRRNDAAARRRALRAQHLGDMKETAFYFVEAWKRDAVRQGHPPLQKDLEAKFLDGLDNALRAWGDDTLDPNEREAWRAWVQLRATAEHARTVNGTR